MSNVAYHLPLEFDPLAVKTIAVGPVCLRCMLVVLVGAVIAMLNLVSCNLIQPKP